MKDVMEWNNMHRNSKTFGHEFYLFAHFDFFLSKHLQFVSFIQMKVRDV